MTMDFPTMLKHLFDVIRLQTLHGREALTYMATEELLYSRISGLAQFSKHLLSIITPQLGSMSFNTLHILRLSSIPEMENSAVSKWDQSQTLCLQTLLF